MDKIVVYTVIIGGYDRLSQPRVVHPDFDYVCFVGPGEATVKKDGVWKIREIEVPGLSKTLLSRYPKLLPHKVLTTYKYSLYIDGNIAIESDDIYRIVLSKIEEGVQFSGIRHPLRSCVYDEIEACLKASKVTLTAALETASWLREQNHPVGYGLYEASVIFRAHKAAKIVRFDELWWDLVSTRAPRDQFFQTYSLRQNAIQNDYLLPSGKNVRNFRGFRYTEHPRFKHYLVRRFFEIFGAVKAGIFRYTQPETGAEKVYIYPNFDKRKSKAGNEYIKYFHEAFAASSDWKLLNSCPWSETGGILLNLSAEVFIVNWVDLIPSKPLGFLQVIVFKTGVLIARGLGKKVIWVLHNKAAHRDHSPKPARMMRWMAANCDLVVTHSKEGVSFFYETYPSSSAQCVYIPHPVYSSEIVPSSHVEYDYIIWGQVEPRKRLLEFLSEAGEEMSSKKVLICGRCKDKDYDFKLREALPWNFEYENSFLSDEELRERIAASKVVLFTYDSSSVLSSGALIYSLNFMKPIIGPRVGSFADMKGIVRCYDSFSEIAKMKPRLDKAAVEKYLYENTWETFPDKIKEVLPEDRG